MKQTAVEWLVEQFEESYSYINEIFKETIEQAKEMEKEQQGYSEEEMKLMFEFGYRKNNFTESTFKDALNYIKQKKK